MTSSQLFSIILVIPGIIFLIAAARLCVQTRLQVPLSCAEGWAKALELRDSETEGHTQRVTELTLKVAGVLGIREGELDHVRRGAAKGIPAA
jgi:HD-GYP domain-containing protein (c-di-GMP phosphodiesterase class II)